MDHLTKERKVARAKLRVAMIGYERVCGAIQEHGAHPKLIRKRGSIAAAINTLALMLKRVDPEFPAAWEDLPET